MPRPSPKDYQNVFDSKASRSSPSMFAAQYQQPQSHSSLYSSTPTSESPQSWPPYDQPALPPFQSQPLPFRGFSTYSTPRRLSTSPRLNVSTNEHTAAATNASRFTLAGSLDPATGIFYRTPEHPRLRTAQACEKCRTRKAKCSGEHPACKRCITRGLVCEYAKEGRVRGPNRAKNASSASGPSQKHSAVSEATELEPHQARTSSTDSSTSSKEQNISPITPIDDRSSRLGEQIVQSPEDVSVSPSHPHPVAHRLQSSPQADFLPLSQQPSPRPPFSQSLFTRNSDTLAGQPSSHDAECAIGGHLGDYRASRTHPVDLLAFPEPWPSQGSNSVTPPRQAGQWISHPTAEIGTGFGFGYGIEQQYPRRLLNHTQQQQERSLQAQRLYPQTSPFVLPYENPLPSHPSQQLASFSTYPLPAPQLQQQSMNFGVGIYPSHYDELTYPREADYTQQQGGMTFMQSNHGFAPQEHDPNALVQRADYPSIPPDTDATERNLHPSLSRMDKGLQIANGTGESEAAGNAAESPTDRREIGAGTGRDQGGARRL